jgi:two-component system, sensor histidine kinase and response regulator
MQENIKREKQYIIRVPEDRRLNILLAEDNPVNTKLAVGLIYLKSWTVDCAANGSEAVALFEVKDYDLILMDIQMPDMDGMEATRRIRQIEKFKGLKPIPIIGLSAHDMKDDIDKALNCGMDDFISKPFKTNELYCIIEKLTGLVS